MKFVLHTLQRFSFVRLGRILILGAQLGFALPAFSASEASVHPREVIPLDKSWRFHLGDESTFRLPDFDDAKWRTLDLPHDWSIEGQINPPPDGDHSGGYFEHGIA